MHNHSAHLERALKNPLSLCGSERRPSADISRVFMHVVEAFSLGPVESGGTSTGALFISLSKPMIFRAPHTRPGLENSISALIS